MNEVIYVEADWNSDFIKDARVGYIVVFEDEDGRSILSRRKTKRAAQRRATHFRRELAAGRLLRPDTSVYARHLGAGRVRLKHRLPKPVNPYVGRARRR